MTELAARVDTLQPAAVQRLPREREVVFVGFGPRDAEVLRTHLAPAGWSARWPPDPASARDLVLGRPPRLVVWNAPPSDLELRQLSRELRDLRLDLPILAFGGRSHDGGSLTWDELDRMTTYLTELPAAGLPVAPDLGSDLTALLGEVGTRGRASSSHALVLLDAAERDRVRRLGGPMGERVLQEALSAAASVRASSLETRHVTESGHVAVVVRRRSEELVRRRVAELSDVVLAAEPVEIGGESVKLTPVIGWGMLDATDVAGVALDRVEGAWGRAARNLDLVPVPARPGDRGAAPVARSAPRHGPATALCVVLTLLFGVAAPLGGLVLASSFGFDLSRWLTFVVVGSLLITSASIWAEGLASRRRPRPPTPVSSTPPRASAIIAAYLPNEASTIVATVHAFLSSEYPDLEVVLAYNTPGPLPVEQELRDLARGDSRLVLLPVPGSTSKAQNVNAAIGVATGAIVGIFDADHHPAPNAFHRAQGWLERGFDVVQGRCVVRNGRSGLLTRLVAVEFEAIYGASHPGRTRLHGFGVFGGSNGYWKASALAATRLQSSMLTEDIDSSIRLVLAGGQIATDPGIVSYELAPTTVTRLWRQRVRWAQGWFQVSRKWGRSIADNPELSRRQKLGMQFLMRWRELNPWITQLVLPLALFQVFAGGALAPWHEAGPALVASLFVLSTGPGQVWFAWRNATSPMRRRPHWFLLYLLAAPVYTEWKNLAARVAHVREMLRMHEWVVTPRG